MGHTGARQGIVTALLAAAALALAVGSAGCAAADDEDGDEDVVPESSESLEQEIRNASITGTKVCVRVLENTILRRDAEGGDTVNTTSIHDAQIVTSKDDPRYVLVQPKPGRVGSRVWADPDLNGLRSDEDIPALAKRCRISIKAAKKAAKKVVRNKYTRRGWIDVKDLSGNLAANMAPNGSTGPAFSNHDRDGSGDLKPGKLRKVKAQCLPQGEYVGSNPKDPAGFYTYGTCIDWKTEGAAVVCKQWGREMYLSYGTPEIDGGGLTLGYVAVGQTVHQLGTHVHEQKGDHCQTDAPGGKVRCNADTPSSQHDRRIVWSEIYARTGGRLVKGWVVEGCLE